MESSSKNQNSENFQTIFNKLLSLSKLEVKKLFIFASACAGCMFAGLFLLILSIVPRLLPQGGSTVLVNLILIAALALFGVAVYFFQSARYSALRLYYVVKPAKESFSIDKNTFSLDPEAQQSISNGKSPLVASAIAVAPQVATDRLPRAAANFYHLIDQSRESVFAIIHQAFQPLAQIHSFVGKRPITSLSIATLIGHSLSMIMIARRNKPISGVPRYDASERFQSLRPKENLLYSTLIDLSMMGLTFAIQTFVKETISKKIKKESLGIAEQSTQPPASRHIIPFDSRFKGSR